MPLGLKYEYKPSTRKLQGDTSVFATSMQHMQPIKIALCITELDIGGAERCLTELAARIDRRRFEPVVYSLSPKPNRTEASCLPILEAAGVETHFLGGRGVLHFLRIVGKLKRLLVAQSPQIIQSFLFHANIVGRIAARRAGVPFVLSGIRVAERAARWHLRLDRLTQRKVDRYVCVSRSVAEFSIQKSGIVPEKIVVIPNGIDPEKYPAPQPADLGQFGMEPGRRAIVFVGRLEPQKGVGWLIESAPLWLDNLPDCDLLIVGDGPMRKSLEAKTSSLGISRRVRFAGHRRDVPQILAASELLVLPSIWEGMPNVVLEAMASHLPVVATKVEGVEELLGHLADGQTVAYGDSQGFAKRIMDFMASPERAAVVGAENRLRAEQHFGISRMVAAYEDLWQSLLDAGK
jgi:glycosyltransferase involved in cell wall biosynthesis